MFRCNFTLPVMNLQYFRYTPVVQLNQSQQQVGGLVLHECSHNLGRSFCSSTQVQYLCRCNACELHSTLLCFLHFFLLTCVLPQFQLQLTVCNSFYLYNERLSSEPDSSIKEMLSDPHILTDISLLSSKAPHSNKGSALTASLM